MKKQLLKTLLFLPFVFAIAASAECKFDSIYNTNEDEKEEISTEAAEKGDIAKADPTFVPVDHFDL
ncbi:MAG TPA: hypothetical protein P5048_03620 [Chlamydiales bacterium]|nr:hypothetical protein [Chlamydiales bacterium]